MVRVSLRLALFALGLGPLCLYGAQQRALFPNNLHLTRQVQDPLSGTTTTIEEYCSGNRMVAISGNRTVIVDYEKQEITEIDRGKGTWSVSRFSDIASADVELGSASASKRRVTADAAGVPQRERWKVTPQGQRGAAGRSVEQFELVDEGEIRRKVDVGVDRSVALTREAVEVLIGAAYPNTARDEHEAVLRAAASARPAAGRGVAANAEAAAEETYGLPLTQTFTYSDSGSELTFRSAITRVGSEMVPPEVLIIPPGAKRVESPAAAVRRQLRELDHPGSSLSPEN